MGTTQNDPAGEMPDEPVPAPCLLGKKKAFYADPKKKPAVLPLNPAGIPATLKALARWVGWRLKFRSDGKGGGRWDKPPVSAHTGNIADCTDPANQGTPGQAWQWVKKKKADGVGFVLGDGFFGMDLDDCRDPDTGELTPFAKWVLARFRSYTEVSPSGTGLKIIGRGVLPPGCRNANKELGIEVYQIGRYFAATGHALDGCEPDVRDLQPAIDAHLPALLGVDPPARPDAGKSEHPPEMPSISEPSGPAPTAEAVIARLLGEWKNADRVRRLWEGDTSGYPSRSEAEYSLLGSIAFFAGPRPELIDEVYQQSKLCPPKWGRLADKTVRKILATMTEFYDWGGGARAVIGGHSRGGNGTADPNAPPRRGDPPVAFVPFPVNALPAPLRPFVRELAAALPCDPANVALPAVAACAAAVGMARVLWIKRSWVEPPILWVAVVAPSGSVKSPPVEHAMAPLSRIDLELRREYACGMKAYLDAERQRKTAERERRRAAAHRGRRTGKDTTPGANDAWEGLEAVPSPARPPKRRCLVQDITLESLGLILSENPKGALVYRDELSAWFHSLNRYSRTDTTADWLTLFSGRMWTMDRKTGDHLTVAVPHAGVSIVGTIQPKVLAQVLTQAFWDAGGAARLLLVMPPPERKRWTDDDVSKATLDAYEAVVRRLWDLRPATGPVGTAPVEIPFTPEAQRRWAEFVDSWGLVTHDAAEADPNLGAAFAKIEGYACRLALVFHLVELAGQGPVPAGTEVGLATLEAAIEVAVWLANEARRVYAALAEDDQGRRRRALADRVARAGGRMSVRDLQRANSRRYPTSAAAEAALQELVAAGWGRWEETSPDGGGHPVKVFVLNAPDPSIPAAEGPVGGPGPCDT